MYDDARNPADQLARNPQRKRQPTEMPNSDGLNAGRDTGNDEGEDKNDQANVLHGRHPFIAEKMQRAPTFSISQRDIRHLVFISGFKSSM
jgi:hypothetical protein